jgi:hypothetical protein
MPRPQKKGVLYLLSLLAVCVSCAGCPKLAEKYPFPKVENCISNGNGTSECTDLRISDKEKQSYTNSNDTNYICTNPADYDILYKDRTDIRQKLIEAEVKINQCRRW